MATDGSANGKYSGSDNRKKLYEAAKSEFEDVGSWEDFDSKMNDEGNRRMFYDAIKDSFEDIGTWDEFNARTGSALNPGGGSDGGSRLAGAAHDDASGAELDGEAGGSKEVSLSTTRANLSSGDLPSGYTKYDYGTDNLYARLNSGGQDFYVPGHEIAKYGSLAGWHKGLEDIPLSVYLRKGDAEELVDLKDYYEKIKDGYNASGKFLSEEEINAENERVASGWNPYERIRLQRELNKAGDELKELLSHREDAFKEGEARKEAEKPEVIDMILHPSRYGVNSQFAHGAGQIPVPPKQVSGAGGQTDLDREIEAKTAEVASLMQSLRDYDSKVEASEASLGKKAWLGLKRGLTNPNTWTMGVFDASVNKGIRDADVSTMAGKDLVEAAQAGEDLSAKAPDPGLLYGATEFLGELAGDPSTFAFFGAGAIAENAAKGALTRGLGKTVGKGMAEDVAKRYVTQGLGRRFLLEGTGKAANFSVFEGLNDIKRQAIDGGWRDDEGNFHEGLSLSHIAKSGGKGALTGALIGVFGEGVSNLTDKLVKGTSGTAAKAGERLLGYGVGKVGEGTIFASEDIYDFQTMPDEEFDKHYAGKYGYSDVADPEERKKARDEARNSLSWDAWDKSMLTIAMMNLHGRLTHPEGAIRTARDRIQELRRADERDHRTFGERLKMMMDRSPRSLDLTKEEQKELERRGYGKMSDMLRRKDTKDPRLTGAAHDESADETAKATLLNRTASRGTEDGVEGNIIVEKGRIRYGDDGRKVENFNADEFDGYEEMDRLVHDGDVPESIRAKAYYLLSGKMLPMSTITGFRWIEHDDGSGIEVQSVNARGDVVTSRRFKSETRAEDEKYDILRQAELNTVDVGERYAERNVSREIAELAFEEVAEKHQGWSADIVAKAYEQGLRDIQDPAKKDKIGKATRELINEVEASIESMSSYYEGLRPEGIRARIKEETGIDVDEALRKLPEDRTEEEAEVVDRYVRELMPEAEPSVAGDSPEAPGDKREAWDGLRLPGAARDREIQAPIGRAVMKYQDRPVEVLSGRVVMMEDGKMVDNDLSDNSIVIRDVVTGQIEMVSPEAILTYEEYSATTEEAGAKPAEVDSSGNIETTSKYTSGLIKIRNSDGTENRGFLTGNVDENGNHEYYVEGDLHNLHYASDLELDNILSEFLPENPEEDPRLAGGGDETGATLLNETASRGPEVVAPQAGLALTEEREDPRLAGASLDEETGEAIITENGNIEDENIPVSAGFTALEGIPRDENGEPMFEKAESPDEGWDALVEYSDGDTETAKEIADTMADQKRKEYEKIQKLKPKGKTPREILESKRSITASLAQAEQEYNLWRSLADVEKNRQEAMRAEQEAEARRLAAEREEAERAERAAQEELERMERDRAAREEAEKKAIAGRDKAMQDAYDRCKDYDEAVELLRMQDPLDIYEAASIVLISNKLLWKTNGTKRGMADETGYKEDERRKLFPMFASAENGGKSLQYLAEDPMKEMCEMNGIPYDNQDALNALLEVLSTASVPSDIKYYIRDRRISAAVKLAEDYEYDAKKYEEECLYRLAESNHLSVEDYKVFEEYARDQIEDALRDFDETEYNSRLADEYAEFEKYNLARKDDVNIIGRGGEDVTEGEGGPDGGKREMGDESQVTSSVDNKESSTGSGRDEGAGEGMSYERGDLLRARAEAERGSSSAGSGDSSIESPASPASPGDKLSPEEASGDKSSPGYKPGDISERGKLGDLGIQAAVEAANAEVNVSPTPAQAEAGNYKKGHVTIGEFDITIENPAGSERKGVDADGKEWSTTMANSYGYIKGTEGVDGDHIDVFLHSDMNQWNGRKAFVVDQTNTDGSFDEHKVMLGFNDKDEAMQAYLSNYDKTWADTHPGLRISETNIEDFNKWIESSHRKTKAFADYSTVDKVVDNAPVKPESQEQSSAAIEGDGYKIVSKPYITKQGKTLDTYLVTFDRDFSKEELSALRAKTKTLKGWYNRESKGWMLRSSEDAKAFAEDVTAKSEDDVADEAPLSLADMEKQTHTTKSKSPAKPKESPVRKVDVEGVFDALNSKGETKLSDHAKPVEEASKPKKRRWISDEDVDEFDSLRKDLRSHFGKDNDMVHEDGTDYGKPQPKQMDADVLRMGTRMTYLMMKGGLRSFADYCEAMKDELPDIFDEMRPHLKSLYAAAQNMEEVMQLGWDEEMDDRKTVKAFDVYNFDKAGAKDIIATAQHIVDETSSQQQTDQIIQNLKDQRNEQRKTEADKTSADTETIIDKAEATASQVESQLESARTEQDAERLSRSIDKEIEEVNKQLALLGYYEADPVDKDFNEAYGYMRNAERKAVNDAHRLATQLASDLGIEIDPKDKVRKSKYGFGSKIARSNVAPAGGEVYITLPLTESRELSIWLSLDKNAPWREGGRQDRYDEDLMLTGIMYRVENTGKGGLNRYESSNHNSRPTISYDELLSDIRRLVRTYLPDEHVKPATPLAPQPGEDIVDMAKRVATDKEPKTPSVEPQLPIGDLFGGLFDEIPETLQPSAPAKEKDADPALKPVIDLLKGGTLKPSKVKNDNLCKLFVQHGEMKQKHPDALLLFRSGNNYQVLSADAEEVAKILGLPLSKFTNDGTEIPFTEFNHHALDKYLPQMVRAGKRVAICEQMDEPEKKDKSVRKSETTTSKQKSDEKKTDVQSRSEEGGRGRQQQRSHEPLGESAEHEDERTDRGGMAGRSGEHSESDTGRSTGVSGQHQSERGVTRTTEAPKNTRNNHAERGVDYAPKGEKARIDANLAAIELAKRLHTSGATATPQEMAILRKYSGWGGLGAAFNEGNSWAPNPINKRLREILTPEEYEAAVMSRNSAYYTPAPVIDAMWDIAKVLGFKGGNIIEGSAGIGNIIGLMPTDISERSNIHAVEIDNTTGDILSLLYPDAKVEVQGFEKTHIGNGTVDLAITNVPFVTGLHVMDESGDSDLSKKFRDIHDFCIAKNVRKLREGGIGIFITSSGTLDKSQKLRNWLVTEKEGNADVVGVFRMNNQTFGGTAATSDIIVVRKRVNGRKSFNAIDVSTVSPARTASFTDDRGKTKDLPLLINRYFIEHPEHMGGEMFFGFEQGDTYRPTSIGLFPTRTADQAERMAAWVQHLADMDWSKEQGKSVIEQTTQINEALGEGVKEGSMVIDSEGNLCVARMGRAVPLALNKNKIKGRTKEECFNDYTEIKSALAEVLKYQTENDDDAGLQQLLDRLNSAYDTFVKRYGNLNKNNNLAWLRNDVDFPSIIALETYSEKGNKDGTKVKTYGKTDIFSRRVVEKESEPAPKNVKDGIIASLYKFGRIDPDYLASQLGKSQNEVKQEIVASGLGFENPTTGQMEVSYEYLSGNVREKLRQAKEANEAAGGSYETNIKALEAVVPMNIPAHLIEFALGSSWIEPQLYEKFVKERTELDVKLTNAGGTWHMSEPWNTDTPKNNGMGVRSESLGIFIPGHKLIEAAITNKTITVSRTVKDSDGTHTETDPAATTVCATKVDEIRQDFKDWAREQMQNDPDLSQRMEEKYNEKFNNSVPKSIPDEFVPKHFGGAATTVGGKPFRLRSHQAKAVIRATTQPVLLAHEVGTGKTYTLITTAMEMRRLGTARKPMIVVQNATVGQFVASAKALYPNAKVLTLEDADRNAEGRKAFYAKIKFNDWDMIVVPQSVFERIPDSVERQTQFIQEKIEEKMLVLEQMKEADPDGRSQIVRAAEREISRLEDEITQLANGGAVSTDNKKEKDAKKAAITRQNAEVKARELLDRATDDVEDFDSIGIDAILVDEAHEYKHLGFATAMQRGVKGVDPSPSKKSQGVFLKAQAVLEKTGGKNVVFATGTPISNTAAEIWTFMRYLMPADVMKDYGIYYFDDFVRNFGNLQQMLEFKTNGKYDEVNRFAGYVNLPELVRIWATVADTVLTREAGGVSDKIPQMEGDKAQDIFLPQTRALRSIMKYVKERLDDYDKMSGKEKKENSHIPLVMYGIAKAAAVDARLVQSDADDDPNSKTNEAVRQTLRTLEETKEYKGTVAIFADNYQNKASGFNLYEDIRKKLIAGGVPEEQVVVMKSGMTVKKKLEIFDKVNAGEVRVVLGSTFTLGTGVNIQERLHTLIHLDAPNRPMDYTQRNGRILRQGNLHNTWNLPVRVLRFGVEDSLDVTAYQRLKTKGAIADSIMNGKQLMENSMENRSLEEDQDLFGDITAQLSGSEYAMLKNQIEKEVRKLRAAEKNWKADQTYIHNRKRQIAGQNREAEKRIAENKGYLEKIEAATIGDIIVGKLSFPSVESMEDFFTEQNKKKAAMQEEVRTSGYSSRPATSDITISVGDFDFKIHTEINRETKQGQTGDLFYSAPAKMTYSCAELGIDAMPVRGNLIKNVVTDIMDNVVSGNDFRERIEHAERYIERNNAELQSMEKRDGVPFKDAEALAKAEEKLEEYEELMKAEMAAKEAKYAELDKDVETASNIELTEEDSEPTTSEPVAEYSAENVNFARRYETADGKTINYTSENPEAYGGLFDFDFSNDVPGGKDATEGGRVNRRQQSNSPLQRKNTALLATASDRLNEANGEYCALERKFRETNFMEFTSGVKVESADDVAFIFEELENASVENVFVVMTKHGVPTAMHISIGGFNWSAMNAVPVKLAFDRIKPDKVYFVHNHPSGNLKCSPQDIDCIRKIEGAIGKEAEGVIMNLKSGKYGTFDSTGIWSSETHDKAPAPAEQMRLRLYAFDRYVFSPEYKPSEKMSSTEDVAKFLSSHRLGDRSKVSVLVCNQQNQIVANVHTTHTRVDAKGLADDIVRAVGEFGGTNALLYGDFEPGNGTAYTTLSKAVKERSGNVFNLLDVVRIGGNHTWSAQNEGLLYEPGSEYGASPEGDIRFREVEDDAILAEFAEGKTVKAYRTMQIIDGKLYSPMATKVGGKATPEIKLGVPEQAEEHPEIIKKTKIGKDGVEVGYVVIDKGLGKGTLEVAYNPSIHASLTPLNDQFTSADIRPNLVIVETLIPKSELTSGYRAPMAKNAVGEMSWHSGTVSGKLAKLGKPRRVILSRYDMPVRIVPFKEVAQMIAAQLDGTDIEMPYNVVQPQVRAELARLGVAISEEATGRVGEEADFGRAEYVTDQEIERINAHQQEMAQTSQEAKSSHAERMLKKFNTPIRIVNDPKELKSSNAEQQARMRRSKGFYDPATGEVVVVVPNNATVEDVAETVFHEVVAHKGLREMLGEENYDAFCDEVYNHIKDDLKEEVDKDTTRRFLNEPGKGYDHHRRVSVDEMFGRLSEKGFEDFTKAERGIWKKLKEKVLDAINKFLGSLKLPKWVKLGDNELRYILWRSHERLRSRGLTPDIPSGPDIVDMARDAAKRHELGLSRNDGIRVREEDAVKEVNRRFNEELTRQIDGTLSEGHIYQIGKPGRILRAAGFPDMNIELSATHLSRKAAQRNHEFDIADMRDLPLEIQRPIAVFRYGDKTKSENVIVGLNKEGKQFVVGVHFNQIRRGTEVSDIRGLFPKDNAEWLNWISQGKAEWLDKEKIQTLIDQQRTNLAEVEYLDLDDVAKVINSFENPKLPEDKSYEYLFRDGETGDIWKDRSVGLEERITNAAIRLSNNQSEDLTLRYDAQRAVVNNLQSLIHSMRNRRGTTRSFVGADRKVKGAVIDAMNAQVKFDRVTVKRVSDLARILMQNGYLSGMTSGEIQRLLSVVKNATASHDISDSVQKIMDIMVNNQLRNAEHTLRQMLSIRGSKVDARGVEVQGMLDVDGQRTMEVVKKAMSLSEDDINDRIAEALNRMSDTDQTIADEAALEYAGLNMALDYVQNIANSKAEEKTLRDGLKTAKEDRNAGRMEDDAYNRFVAVTEDAIRKNKVERAESYFNLVGRLSDSLRESIANAKAFREAEKVRINEIYHNANSDMEGRPTEEHSKENWKDKFMNNDLVQFLFAPLRTFDQILRVFGNKSANGEGYLWNRFMRGWVECRNRELVGVKEKFARLDEKAAEVFAKAQPGYKNIKVKTWGDLIRLERKLPKATVSFWDGGERREHKLTQGNLLYIYMVDKMTDGRMKLRRMGITDNDIAAIEDFLDPRFKALGDWMQDEFLVDTRNEYNETHKRMFGASMAAIENYFPLKILANARVDKEEDVNQQNRPDGITTKTGSIIKRRVNNLALDITGADALSVILDHITQMEHWNAYAEWNRDLNTLRTYKRFRNQVINMTTVYGGGRKLWERFNDLCLMAAGEYRPPVSDLNKSAVNLAKGVTAAKVSFRMFTALKQLLSAPAYIPEVSCAAIAKSIINPYGDFKWCMENMPIFRERWHSRISGDPRLLKSDMDWKMWRNRIMEISSRIGMTPNAFVDAVTVSIGAKAIYDTRLKQYLKEGYAADDAEKRALQDATILFNQTQQSSESPFLSTIQVDKDWLSTLVTIFRNSSMSYTRQQYDAMRNLKRNLTPGQRAQSIEFMKKQILRDWGIEPDTASDTEQSQAENAAKMRFRRQIKKDLLRVATFGFILEALWNLGPYLPYIIFGNNDDEKDKMWDDAMTHAYFGSFEGLTGGDVMSSFGNMAASGEWSWNQLSKDMPLTSDINTIARKFIGHKNAEAVNDIVNLLVQMGVGMNPQSITDAAIAITDACGDDPELSHEAAIFAMRVLQVPQSQIDKMYFDEIDLTGTEASKLTPAELARRYAEYKVKRGTPLAPWSWGDEERLGKYKKAAVGKMQERLDAQGDAKVKDAYADFEARYKAVSKKAREAKDLVKTDYVAAAQAYDALHQDPDFVLYQQFGNLGKQLKRISDMWLTSKSPEEAALISSTISSYRAGMVKVLQARTEDSRESAMSELETLTDDFYNRYEDLQPKRVSR